jgi:hypothetical protein
MRFTLTSLVVLGSLICAFGCEDVKHEIILRNGDLGWANAAEGAKRAFFIISGVSLATLFL